MGAKRQISSSAKKLMALPDPCSALFAQKSRELWNAKSFEWSEQFARGLRRFCLQVWILSRPQIPISPALHTVISYSTQRYIKPLFRDLTVFGAFGWKPILIPFLILTPWHWQPGFIPCLWAQPFESPYRPDKKANLPPELDDDSMPCWISALQITRDILDLMVFKLTPWELQFVAIE